MGKYRISNCLCVQALCVDPGRRQQARPVPPTMLPCGHTPPPQCPLLSLGGLHASIGGQVREPSAPWKGSDKPIHGKPIHNGADFAPSKDRALLIIQGTVQLCKSVGSLCPTAVFCRSPGGRGCPEPKQLGTRREPPSPGKGE